MLMKDVGGEAGRLREVVDGLSAISIHAPPVAPDVALPDTSRLDELAAAVTGLSGKLDAVSAAIADRQSPAPTLGHAAEKDGLQRMLAGFRLLLRDLSGEVEALRAKVSAIETPAIAGGSGFDPALPLREAASEISIGVAETLAAIELKLDEPLARLTEATAESAKLLQVAHAAMASPARPAATGTSVPAEALADAVGRIERAAGLIDERVGGVDRLAAQLKRQGAGTDAALSGLIGELKVAAQELRAESGDFVAVSAALSRDLERAAGIEPSQEAPQKPARTGRDRKRAA
jgi:hypothetical protein